MQSAVRVPCLGPRDLCLWVSPTLAFPRPVVWARTGNVVPLGKGVVMMVVVLEWRPDCYDLPT